MKLLFISNLYPPLSIGGYEEICFDVAEGLRRRGHQVSILTSSFKAEQIKSPERSVYRILKVSSNWLLSPDGPTPWVCRSRLKLNYHNFVAMRDAVARLRPDAMVCWNGGLMGRSLVLEVPGSPHVLYYLFDAWLAPLLAEQAAPRVRPTKRLYRKGLELIGMKTKSIPAQALVFGSHALRAQYQEAGIDIGQSQVIYPSVSPLFYLREQHILQRNSLKPAKLLFSGRIIANKGVTTLVKALSNVRAIPGLEATRLSLVGPLQDDEYQVRLRQLIRQLSLDNAIEFVPRQTREELPKLYAEHDLLVFPSEWREPFALTLLEAMAVGLPVVSTTCGGSAELIRHGGNAMAFRAGDSDDLAENVAWLLLHPTEAAAIGRAASDEVMRSYTLEAQLTALEARLEGSWPRERPATRVTFAGRASEPQESQL